MLTDLESQRKTPAKPPLNGTAALLNTLLLDGMAFRWMMGLPL